MPKTKKWLKKSKVRRATTPSTTSTTTSAVLHTVVPRMVADAVTSVPSTIAHERISTASDTKTESKNPISSSSSSSAESSSAPSKPTDIAASDDVISAVTSDESSDGETSAWYFDSPLTLKLGYKFQNRALLDQALTRKSALEGQTESKSSTQITSNERFEFLGDSILRTVIDDVLLESYPDWNTAQLSKARDDLVSKKGFLYKAAVKLNLLKFATLGKAELSHCDGPGKYTVLSSLMEAVIGAVFLDCDRDYAQIKQFILMYAGFRNQPTYNKDVRLFEAVKKQDLESIHYWLAQGANPNRWYKFSVQVPQPYPVLINTCDYSAVLHTSDVSNALMLALHRFGGINKDTPAIVDALLSAGAHPGQTERASLTPLLYETIAYDKMNSSVEKEKANLVLTGILCRHGANPNERSYVARVDGEVYTPFEIAILQGDDAAVQMLLKYGANPNLKNSAGRMPLHLVALCIERRCRSIPSTATTSTSGFSAGLFKPHFEKVAPYRRMINLLIQYGANLHARDKNGDTPAGLTLHPAVQDLLKPVAKSVIDLVVEGNDAPSVEDFNCVLS